MDEDIPERKRELYNLQLLYTALLLTVCHIVMKHINSTNAKLFLLLVCWLSRDLTYIVAVGDCEHLLVKG